MAASSAAIKHKLEKCVKKRERLFVRLQLCYDLIKEVKDENRKQVFLSRCAELSSLYLNFETLAEEMDELNACLESDTDKVSTDAACKQFDVLFYEIKAIYDTLTRTEARPSVPTGTSLVQPKLPQIDINKFGGKLEEFNSFKALFDNLINNSAMTAIEKFSYLKSLLEGTALSVIETIPFDPDHYELAYKTLVDRYTNPRILASFYLNKILEHPPVKSPNLSAFRNIIDIFHINVEALKNLNIDDLSGFVFLQIALRLLDHNSRKLFEQEYKSVQFPELKHLIEFLRSQCAILELTRDNSKSSSITKPFVSSARKSLMTTHPNTSKVDKLSYISAPQKSTLVCPLCKSDHQLYRCSQFLDMNPSKRHATVRSFKRCFACLGSHWVSDCTSTSSCRHCQSKRHHSLLHQDITDKVTKSANLNSSNETTDKEATSVSPAADNHTTNALSCSTRNNVHSALLSTAQVLIRDSLGDWQPCRVVIDTGSQVNFITSALAQSIRLSSRKCSINISGIGQSSHVSAKGIISCCISSRFNHKNKIDLDAVIIPKISSELPSSRLSQDLKKRFSSLSLADPYFDRPTKIDMLLGIQAFTEILTDGNSIIRGKPTAFHTLFGWVLMGDVPSKGEVNYANSFFTPLAESTDQLLRKFWEIEEINCPKPVDPEELICEEYFASTITRDETGRYIASLPFKDKTPLNLGCNRDTALRKLYVLENRFQSQPKYKEMYVNSIDDYLKNKHLIVANKPSSYVLTHHGVLKESSSSSPLRVVFNASELSNTNNSLNKSLLIGPKLQADIGNILTNFRMYPVALTCDIKQMYRAIRLSPADCQYQHIFWRSDQSSPIQEYELQRLTFGISSSPFIAQRTLKQLILDEGSEYTQAAEVLNCCCYIDDIVSGASSEAEAISLYEELTSMLRLGGFELHKWSSSCPNVMKVIPQSLKETSHPLGSDNTIKVLGLEWDPNSDCFRYSITSIDETPTKRNILSQIARIYDVNGYISPIIFTLKHVMQQLWLEKCGWDDLVPLNLRMKWKKIVSEISLLTDLKIPRFILSSYISLQIVGFSDASKIGMCAIIYLIIVRDDGNIISHIIQSKTKVSPLKTLSIPRLELCAALLLSRLVFSNQGFISKYRIQKVILLTDSMNVLGWLQTSPHLLETFVANRVCKILETTKCDQWQHVPGKENPADCGSRGLLPSEIINNSFWWHGPSFLQQPENLWQKCFVPQPDIAITENNRFTTLASLPIDMGCTYLNEMISKYSSLTKLKNIMGYVIRFIANVRNPNSQRKYGSLSTEELKASTITCVKVTQNIYYSADLAALKNEKPCSKALQSFSPFLSNGILMVGGRLRHAPLSQTAKHPWLIPSKSHLAALICDHYHINTLHGGPKLVQSIIQRQYWIPGIRNLLRKRIFKCLRCFKMKAKPMQPLMADLPPSRFQQGRCFENVGLDFAGPYLVKEGTRRNARLSKCYIALFVCMSVKAIHLELVGFLTTESCIAAIDRFISRRGIPRNIYSDQGTNFIGAARHLKEIYELLQTTNTTLSEHLTKQDITWNFNPPKAANFGGLWEAGVKSTKHHLRRVLENHNFTVEELTTFLCRIEAILNSRPLCPISSCPDDGFDYLTPGHFLIGGPLICRPEEDVSQEPLNHLTRWKKLSHATHVFWKKWSREYLQTLIPRSKWTANKTNLKEGNLVLMYNVNMSPLNWPLGRVTKVFPGKDGTVRVVEVKTPAGTLIRPVNKLVPFP